MTQDLAVLNLALSDDPVPVLVSKPGMEYYHQASFVGRGKDTDSALRCHQYVFLRWDFWPVHRLQRAVRGGDAVLGAQGSEKAGVPLK